MGKTYIFKTLIVIALFTVGVGLILNSVNVANADGSEAQSELTVEEMQAIENELARLHPGQWFGWADPENKTYAGLTVYDLQYSKPTKQSLLDAVAVYNANQATQDSQRSNLKTKILGIESRIKSGDYTSQDLADYVRYLGGF